MKKTMKTAMAMAVLATPAFANLENPLYLPQAGEAYSKLGAGVMYKIADDTVAMKAKNADGSTEFPIWRGAADLGYGITDWLTIRGQFGYTHNNDIKRQGMHLGRIDLVGRVFDGKTTDGIVWDVYGAAHLGGVSPMTGKFDMIRKSFTYDNYSNGRWGFYVGSQVGKTWNKFTGAAFVEVLQTFGNDNNEIDMRATKAEAGAMVANCTAGYALMGFPDATTCANTLGAIASLTPELSVNLKSTREWSVGLKGNYQIDSAWSVGSAFTWKQRAANGVKSVATKQAPLGQAGLVPVMEAELKDMQDGLNEYIVGLSVANQLTKNVQVALYGEYTFDTAEKNSQNGTDVKAELGARVNVSF